MLESHTVSKRERTVDGPEGLDNPREAYNRLSRAAPNRLTVSTFFAGFTLAAFIALFTVAPHLDHLDQSSVVILLADVFVGTSTLLFIFTAIASYVPMQRLTLLSPAATEELSRDDGQTPVLSPADSALLYELEVMYDEPAPFIVWGMMLVTVGILLVGWRIYPPMGVFFLLVLIAIVYRVRTLHAILMDVLMRRRSPSPHAGQR